MEGGIDAGGRDTGRISGRISALAFMRKGEDVLRSGVPGASLEARRLFEEALRKDYGDKAAKFALKSLLWWQRRLLPYAPYANGPEKGGAIVDEWEGFYRFLDGIGDMDSSVDHAGWDALRAVRHWVSAAALEAFAYNPLNSSQSGDWGLQFKLGLCYKGLGDYENARVFLDTASGLKRDDVSLLFERADVKALAAEGDAGSGGDEEARRIFREAFLADPQKVCVYSMESAFFRGLYRTVAERGYEGAEILEWMPVWGTLMGAFPFPCELNQIKLGKLKARIFELENELKTEGGSGSQKGEQTGVPRLLNGYFWLLEHYDASRQREEPQQGLDRLVEETLLKIEWTCSGTRSIPEQVMRGRYFAGFNR
jgi:tetratricopeptide (TPR) repeat protein